MAKTNFEKLRVYQLSESTSFTGEQLTTDN